MVLPYFKNIAYRWMRLCVLWMVLFLIMCLYIVHFNTRSSIRTYNLDMDAKVLRVPVPPQTSQRRRTDSNSDRSIEFITDTDTIISKKLNINQSLDDIIKSQSTNSYNFYNTIGKSSTPEPFINVRNEEDNLRNEGSDDNDNDNAIIDEMDKKDEDNNNSNHNDDNNNDNNNNNNDNNNNDNNDTKDNNNDNIEEEKVEVEEEVVNDTNLFSSLDKATFARLYAQKYISKNLGGNPPNVIVEKLPPEVIKATKSTIPAPDDSDSDLDTDSDTTGLDNKGSGLVNQHARTYEQILEKLVFQAVNEATPPTSTSSNRGFPKPLRFTLPNMYKKWNVPWTVRESGFYPKVIYSPPDSEIPKQRLPQVILFGVGKCGTRALIEFLGMNPFVVYAKNEIHYFDVNSGNGLEWYRQQMPLSYSNQVTMEKSPSYIWFDGALDGIYHMNPHMKLLLIVKDPVDRVVSQAIRSKKGDYLMTLANKDAKGNYQIHETSNTLIWGAYHQYLRKWIDKFGEKQIHVIEAQELAADPAGEIMKVEKFLGVPSRITENNFFFNKTKGFHCMRPFHLKDKVVCLSDGKGIKHPDLPPEVEKLMYDYYAPHNEALYKLLGRRFNWVPSYLKNKDENIVVSKDKDRD